MSWPRGVSGTWGQKPDWNVLKRGIDTMEYSSAIKKNEISPFAATRMDLEGIMLSERSQTVKNKYCMISLICGI